tara:strand:- start:523 stop:705 length:183 start_codon:yes stop_codon:yes gene_type:complete
MTALDVLKQEQKRLDASGVMVAVSRQALDEVIEDYERQIRENILLRKKIDYLTDVESTDH